MPVPGQRAVAVPGQQTAGVSGQRDVTGERRGRAATPKGRPALALVPPPRTVPDEGPGMPALAPEPGTGTETETETDERTRRPARQAPVRPGQSPAARARVPGAQVPGAQARPHTRLTRRGRIVVAALIVAVMLLVAALAWIAGAAKVEAAGSGPPPSAVYHNLRSVVVQPGQSLWTIAAQDEPNADAWSVIQQIIDLNALGGTSVQPGQHLWIPRG